jgi:hypothetical protein
MLSKESDDEGEDEPVVLSRSGKGTIPQGTVGRERFDI